ncbi:MAG: redox-sensing transcriptional repressor Rex [bacterium]
MENEINNRDFSKIPKVVIKRLFKYHSALEKLIIDGISNVSSSELSDDVNVKASQLRKDLAYCGEFGTRGKGYEVSYLHDKLSEILGLQMEWNYILAGLGRLGRALVNYKGLVSRGFKIKAIFDISAEKIGQPYHDIMVYHIDEMQSVIQDMDIRIGLITVPADAAQSVCDKMVEAKISAILNFAPVLLKTKDKVFIERVDISREMVTLSHYLSHHECQEKN